MMSDSQHQAQLSYHCKMNLQRFDRSTSCLFRGTIAVLSSIAATSLVGFNTAAQAQAEFGNFGITTPSERFRQEGQDRIEQEIHRLYAPPETEELLTIDDDVNVQEELLQFEDPRWRLQNIPEDDRSDGSVVGNG